MAAAHAAGRRRVLLVSFAPSCPDGSLARAADNRARYDDFTRSYAALDRCAVFDRERSEGWLLYALPPCPPSAAAMGLFTPAWMREVFGAAVQPPPPGALWGLLFLSTPLFDEGVARAPFVERFPAMALQSSGRVSPLAYASGRDGVYSPTQAGSSGPESMSMSTGSIASMLDSLSALQNSLKFGGGGGGASLPPPLPPGPVPPLSMMPPNFLANAAAALPGAHIAHPYAVDPRTGFAPPPPLPPSHHAPSMPQAPPLPYAHLFGGGPPPHGLIPGGFGGIGGAPIDPRFLAAVASMHGGGGDRERDLRDGGMREQWRDHRDERHPRGFSREPRDPRDTRDPRDLRDARDSRDPRDPRDFRDARDPRDPRDPRDFRDARDPSSRDFRDGPSRGDGRHYDRGGDGFERGRDGFDGGGRARAHGGFGRGGGGFRGGR